MSTHDPSPSGGDSGPYAYLWIDAQTQRCRDGGRLVNVVTVTAIGVNTEGYRELLGCDVITSEDGAGWPGQHGSSERIGRAVILIGPQI